MTKYETLIAAGDELAATVDSALETHIYEPGETPDDAPELAAIAAWEAAKAEPCNTPPIDVPAGPLSSFDFALLADALDCLDPDGSEATNRKQELEAWARQMAETGRGYLPAAVPGHTAPAIRVLVALEGGCVQGIIADRAGVEAIVLDYDTDGADAAELYAIPQDGGDTAEAIRSTWGAIQCDPAFIDGAALAPHPDAEEDRLAEPVTGDPFSAEQLRDRLAPAYAAAEEAMRRD